MKRKTVNLSDEDYEELRRFFDPNAPERRSLVAGVGEEPEAYSDSAVLRALALRGARVIRQQLLAEGYKQLAESYDTEDRAWAEASLEMAAETWRD